MRHGARDWRLLGCPQTIALYFYSQWQLPIPHGFFYLLLFHLQPPPLLSFTPLSDSFPRSHVIAHDSSRDITHPPLSLTLILPSLLSHFFQTIYVAKQVIDAATTFVAAAVAQAPPKVAAPTKITAAFAASNSRPSAARLYDGRRVRRWRTAMGGSG